MQKRKITGYLMLLALPLLSSCFDSLKQSPKKQEKTATLETPSVPLIPHEHEWAHQPFAPVKPDLIDDKKNGFSEAVSHTDFDQKLDREKEVDDYLWSYIIVSSSLETPEQKAVTKAYERIDRHPKLFLNVLRRAEPFLYLIVSELESAGLPVDFALLPVVESAYQTHAFSHEGAVGLWQFVGATGRMYGLKQNWWYDGRQDVMASTRAAARYLKKLSREFDGDWMLALAAYNAGPGTVRKAIAKNQKRGKDTSFWSLQLPRETRHYVPRFLAAIKWLKDAEARGLDLPPVKNSPYLQEVLVDSQIALERVASLADIALSDVYALNPGMKRWASDPEGPHTFLLPIEKASVFQENLSQLPKEERVVWVRHFIQEGETLSHIGLKYDVPVALIKKVNKITGYRIRAGKSLFVPKSSANAVANAEQEKVKVVHFVRKGETLSEIAMSYDVGIKDIQRWNKISHPKRVRMGQQLIVWKKTDQYTLPQLASNSHHDVQTIGYRVQSGDSLSKIAAKFNLKISDLRRWNKVLKNQKYLQPGQVLKVPALAGTS
ncbi:MAG: LysM peptidoglycan-binding domain-containing protein [Gammaproteobacteria bacterium]|nr:LysM peptidoglycan-binding domain-containing protein [Gammaproteobacteria bacterium]